MTRAHGVPASFARRPSGLRSAEVPASRYAPIPKWWGRRHFVDVALPRALQLRPDALRDVGGGNVAAATFLLVMRTEADAANADGTVLIIAADTVAARAGVSPRTVKRCRTVARRLGVYRTLLYGRPGTLDERLEQGGYVPGAWPRRLANETCFTMPRWLAVALTADARRKARRARSATLQQPRCPQPSPAATSIELGTMAHPPGGPRPVSSKGPGNHGVSRPTNRIRDMAAPPPAPTKRAGPSPGPLAVGLTLPDSPIPCLRGTSAARIGPALRPFEEAGWTRRDVERQVRTLRPHDWDRPHAETPWRWLAWSLRRTCPHSDRPSLLDQIEAERRREERQRARLAAAAARASASPPTGEYLAARQQLDEQLALRQRGE